MQRRFVPPLAELLDRLTVDQIKEVLIPAQADAVAEEMEKIAHDIDLLARERGIETSAHLLRIVIALAQLNVHIWYNKDQMQRDAGRYSELLKFAHQLNGVRNQLKNALLVECGDADKGAQHTNFNTDGLEGWNLSVLRNG